MANRDWELLGELVAAVGVAHTTRALPRAIGERLPGAVRVLFRVASDDSQVAVAESSVRLDRWDVGPTRNEKVRQFAKGPRLDRPASGQRLTLPYSRDQVVVGELVITFAPTAPPILDDPTYLQTLAHVVSVGLENQRLVLRVADLSRRAHAENRELRANLDRLAPATSIVARSPAMQQIVERVAMVSRYDTAVLIFGESGTGKEVISREIHRRSSRSRKPFLQVNCGAIPPHLVESELFGHEKGAFTGAERSHSGLFERAHGGTLLLDEVADLPLAAQVKLLRVLQERRVRRVGGEIEIAVDVRVIAATNRPIASMVAIGEFREDLYYRLNVFPLEIPPLRERREDLPLLVNDLLRELAERLRGRPPALSDEVLKRFKAHEWPGNVRELANVLEAAMVLGGGRTLELPPDFAGQAARGKRAGRSENDTFADHARKAIEAALRTTRGKIYGEDGAAAKLGLKPATLQSKMIKLGIQRERFL